MMRVAAALSWGAIVVLGDECRGSHSQLLTCSAQDEGSSSGCRQKNELEDDALLLADYYKRLDRPELSLAGWQKVCVYS